MATGLIKFNIPASEIPLGLNSTEAFAGIVPGLPKTYPGGTVSIVLTVGSAASTVLLSHGAVGKAA
jgi:hypothetical protein